MMMYKKPTTGWKTAVLLWLGVSLMISWVLPAHAQQERPLAEAIAEGLVVVHIHGRSIAFVEPMLDMTLTNQTSDELHLFLPAGMQLQSNNPSYANALLARDELIVLAGNEARQMGLYAYSQEPDKAFPDASVTYSLDEPIYRTEVMVLLETIGQQGAESEVAGQIALWMTLLDETDFAAFTAEYSNGNDLTPYEKQTLELMGQEVKTAVSPFVLIGSIVSVGLFLAIFVYVKREVSQTFDGYKLGYHVATGGKYNVRQARRRGGAIDLIIKEPVDHATEANCVREIEIREQFDEMPPNIVPLFSSGYYSRDKNSRAMPYLVERYIHGFDLGRVLQEVTKVEANQALEIIAQLLNALEHLHNQHQIVHRDLRPSNILLDRDGRVWLTDFGSAINGNTPDYTFVRREEANSSHWLAPEVVRRSQAHYLANGKGARPTTPQQTIDKRADIYSLGAILYLLLLGEPPFDLKQARHFFEVLPPQLDKLTSFEPYIAQAIRRCLAAEPEERFGTIAELRHSLNLPLPPTQSAQARAELGELVQMIAAELKR